MKLQRAAIIRDGKVYDGFKSHWEIRAYTLKDEDPQKRQRGDVEGFTTDTGRFLTRQEAIPVAIDAGQLSERYRDLQRDLLSSDIDW